jgi:outer membrane protein TolC
VGFLNQRESTDSLFATNPKFFDSAGQFTLTQPLLNNGLGYQTRQNLSLAKRQAEAVAAGVEGRLQDIAYQHVLLYWTWYFHHHLYAIDKEALTLAQKLYQTNRQKSVVGLIEDADLYAFAANINIKNNDLLITAGSRDKAKGEVQAALNLVDTDIKPGNESGGKNSMSTVEKMTAEALAGHPQLVALQKELKALGIAVAMKKNSRLPVVDLNASLTLNGIDPAYGTAIADIENGNPLWHTGVSISFPLQNRGARSQLKKSELVRMQKILAIQQKETDITTLIRQLHARLMQNTRRLGVTAQAVENQRKKWGEEIRKYDQGRSDTDMVIRYQDDYLNARRMQLKAKVDYEHARVELDYARGRLWMDDTK